MSDYIKGDTYVLRILIPPKRLPRESCMTFLGRNKDGTTSWNARPAAGTQELKEEWILRAQRVGRSQGRDNPVHYVNRIIRDTWPTERMR